MLGCREEGKKAGNANDGMFVLLVSKLPSALKLLNLV